MDEKRIIEIDKQIIELEREKKNFCRRRNYRIGKLRKEKEALLDAQKQPSKPEILDANNKTVKLEKPQPVAPEQFEITPNGRSVDVLGNNRWSESDILSLNVGEFIRLREEDIVISMYGSKTFEVVSLPHRNQTGEYCVLAKIPD